MTRYRPSRALLPLVLLALLVMPDAAANTIKDSEDREWKAYTLADGMTRRVRIEITSMAGPENTFWATNSNSNDPFLYLFHHQTHGDQIWLVWSRERDTNPGQYDIFHRQVFADGALGANTPVVRASTNVDYSDVKPSGALCPLGHHIAFQRETPGAGGIDRQIYYVNNLIHDENLNGDWTLTTPNQFLLTSGRTGSEVSLLIGNSETGSPLMVIFKEWVTQRYLSGLKRRTSFTSIWIRELDGPSDPNPWERIKGGKLPDNPS